MIEIVRGWFDRYFSNEEAVVLALMLLVGFGVVLVWGDILAPVIGAMIIAFILQGPVTFLNNKNVKPIISVSLVFGAFVSLISALFLSVLPAAYRQLESLIGDMPKIILTLQEYTSQLQQRFPDLIKAEDLARAYEQLSAGSGELVQWVFSSSLAGLPAMISVLIYLVVVPILVFFFLKDRVLILNAVSKALPSRRGVVVTVAKEMNLQFANYLRGKALEILVVGVASYLCFKLFGLNYSALLAILVGLSVVIPYIGAVVVTIPVLLIALFQFGLESQFYYVMIAYLIIQMLDGNVLVPLLFSEVVNLHPILIIVAVLFFGGVWGFWGVFFAIPLATLVKAVISAWPRNPVPEQSSQDVV
jgi:putative permease